MAALDFPSSPTIGQVYTANGKSWQWDGTAWVSYNRIISIGVTGSSMTIYGSPVNFPDATSLVFTNSINVSAPSYINFDSDTLFIDATNNAVGVGLTNPASYLGKFGVDGNIAQSSGGYHYFWDAANTFGWYIRNVSNTLALGQYAGSETARLISKGLLVGYTSDSGLSGTGNAIFSGSVGIGTSSPAEKLTVVGNIRVSSGNALYLYNATNDGLGIWYNPGGAGVNQLTARVNGADRVTIDSSGNLGLGVTPYNWQSPFRVIDINTGGFGIMASADYGAISTNLYYSSGWKYKTTSTVAVGIYEQYNGSHRWYSAPAGTANNTVVPTQAMTLDTSGNLLVGKTLPATANIGWELYQSGGSRTSMSASTNTASTLEVYSTGASAYRFYVDMAGTIHATSTTITAISSDERLKQNIVDFDKGLDQVLALRPRYFEYKKEPGFVRSGFIAQEVETIMPEAIKPIKDDPEHLTYSIDWNTMLVKAIQELHAEIELLKAKVN